VHNIKHNY